MTRTITAPPDWTYQTPCLTCGRNYITDYGRDYGYCSMTCAKQDEWRED